MKFRLLYLLAGIVMLFSFVQCKDSVTQTTGAAPNPDPGQGLKGPTLFTPEDDSEQPSSVTFEWKDVKRAQSFQIRISEDENFESIMVDSVVDSTTYSTKSLPLDTTLHWQVRPLFNNQARPLVTNQVRPSANNMEGPWSETWNFRTVRESDNSEPISTELERPDDGADGRPTNVTLKWQEVAGATEYKFQLVADQNLDTVIVDETMENTSYQTSGLEYAEDYYWRVEPVVAEEETEWSELYGFTTESQEQATTLVTLNSPEDGANNVSTGPTLEWEAVSGISSYQVQVGTSDSFSSPTIDDTVEATSHEVSTLDNGQTYYWRVQTTGDNDTGNWSQVYEFTTEETTPSVTLVSPEDGATNLATTLSLEWEAISDVSSYQVQVGTSDSFSSPTVDENVEATSHEVSTLDNGQTYYWRVQATGDNDTGNWSQVYELTTEEATPAVTLVSPEDGATNLATTLSLEWEAISDVSSYQVQVASSSSFSSPIVDEVASNTSYEVSSLNNSQTYYWRVQADGDGNVENWSSVQSFDTESGTTNEPSGSRSGDEQALEDLYDSANGGSWANNNGWSSSGMSLSDNIYGVEVETINGELRVTEINLRDNNLTGSIDNASLGNLTEMKLFAVYWNNLNSRIPPELMSLTNLEYLYLGVTGNLSDDFDAGEHPHDFAQTGGGDIHKGKEKGSEGNIFTGPIPGPNNPSSMNMKWLIVNWTDSAEDVADGVSSVDPSLFDITTWVGLQIINNNNIADLPFPDAITNATNLDQLKLGVGKSGKATGYLTGSVPPEIGNLVNIRYLDLNENPNLTIDFDVVDFTSLTKLRAFYAQFVDIKGEFPAALTDGTMPNLVFVNISWPTGPGVTGTLAEGGTELQALMMSGHSLEEIPDGFWNNTELINTNFGYNNLTTIGTDDLTQLGDEYWDIRNLRWSNNSVSGRWPNLAWGTERLSEFSRAYFDKNKYVFSDMLWVPNEYNPNNKTIFELYQDHGLSSFRYGDQKPFGQGGTIDITVGSDITLDNFDGVVTHPDNRYQWQKDGSDISGATNRSLRITSVGTADVGTYRLVVTNPNIPGMTLTSETLKIQ